jgi:hypothetical protein
MFDSAELISLPGVRIREKVLFEAWIPAPSAVVMKDKLS